MSEADLQITGPNLRIGVGHERADALVCTFNRTNRLPYEGGPYPLPPGIGTFPLECVRDHSTRLVPSSWQKYPGIFFPMNEEEAFWINFSNRGCPKAIKFAAGRVNCITGEKWSDGLHDDPQDYMVVGFPGRSQPWLDGHHCGPGFIRQFVATPKGSGKSVEAQVTGEEKYGGIQMLVYRAKKYPPRSTRRVVHYEAEGEFGGEGEEEEEEGGGEFEIDWNAEDDDMGEGEGEGECGFEGEGEGGFDDFDEPMCEGGPSPEDEMGSVALDQSAANMGENSDPVMSSSTEESVEVVDLPPQPPADSMSVPIELAHKKPPAMSMSTGFEEGQVGDASSLGILDGKPHPSSGSSSTSSPRRRHEKMKQHPLPKQEKVPQEMCLAAGGKMKQNIVRDPKGLEHWDQESGGVSVWIHLVSARGFFEVTGKSFGEPPAAWTRETTAAVPTDGNSDLEVTEVMANVKGLGELNKED